MRTVHEVSAIAGVSIRTLQHYDNIGLLQPAKRSTAGYRLYSEGDLVRLQQILLFRELGFSLKDIRRIVSSSDFEQTRALSMQIELLELKRERLGKLIRLARQLQEEKGAHTVSFEAFDTSKIDEYAEQARAAWGESPAWKEYERKSARRTKDEQAALGADLMALFVPFGRMAAAGKDPASDEAKRQAKRIQDFITEHYYTCTDEIFAQLGKAYGSGGEFTRNIDATAGSGAAEFAAQAVEALVAQRDE